MCAKSRKSLRELKRPFSPVILAKARDIADQYQVVLWKEDGHWYGRGLEMPTVFGDGPTTDAAVKLTREGLIATVACLLEAGQPAPMPAAAGVRAEQVNVLLSANEKLSFESAAHSRGFDGLSDFIRSTVMQAIAGK